MARLPSFDVNQKDLTTDPKDSQRDQTISIPLDEKSPENSLIASGTCETVHEKIDFCVNMGVKRF